MGCWALFAPGASGWGFRRPARFENPEFVVSWDGSGVLVGDRRASLRRLVLDIEGSVEDGYWVLGYFGYESHEQTLGVHPRKRAEERRFPRASFMFFSSGPEPAPLPNDSGVQICGKLEPRIGRDSFVRMVRRVKEYIASGDVYQVNISRRFDLSGLDGDPLRIFGKLYRAQPVPFGCLLDFDDFKIVSGSMELFLRREGNVLISRPIKGTRPRGGTETADEHLCAELRDSEKDRAENLMIVDLVRNDLARVCERGSVRVTRLFGIEAYATLYHMVSEIEGTLRGGTDLWEILRATFPPGSVTGAPKVRAVEIIDELEPHFREPYCGAIALFKPGGDFVMSVAIRVLALRGGSGWFWAGGGITWGSDPEAEYEETAVKARALTRALGRGGCGSS